VGADGDFVTTSTLTEEQWRIRERVLYRVERDDMPARDALLLDLADGARAEDVAAVADDLCPGAGEDYRR
jgi:hypothetical protein